MKETQILVPTEGGCNPICENAEILGHRLKTNFQCHSNRAIYWFTIGYPDGVVDANCLCHDCMENGVVAANISNFKYTIEPINGPKREEIGSRGN